MRLKQLILILFCVFSFFGSFAQIQGELVQSRVLILLDESSSMIQTWSGGKQKYKAARELILRLMDSVYAVNGQVEFSLRVFGHQHTVAENDCYDTKNEVAFHKDNRLQMAARLEDISPLGVTPIAFALTQAAEKDIVDESHNAYSIILITDGGESCGGDICDVMKKLIQYKVYFKPYIVSLENDPSLRTTYSCMGDFLQVTKEKDIPKAVSAIVAAFRPVIKLSSEEYKQLQNISANAPSVLKVNVPVIRADTPKHKPAEPKKWKAPASENIAPMTPAMGKPVSIAPVPASSLNTIDLHIQAPKMIVDLPERPQAVKIAAANRPAPVNIPVMQPAPQTVQPIKNNLRMPKLAVDTPARVIENIAKMRPIRPRQFNVIFVIEDHTFAMLQVPAMPPMKADLAPAPEAGHDVKVETTDSKETTVSVYFTNGTGKYYTTTPQVVLLDPATKKPVHKFFRFVDPSGNPDPQKDIAPGVYDFTLAARSDYLKPGIKIEANKNNKVTFIVKNTTLRFAYDKAPTRPMKEFYAVVTERTKAQGRVQEQKCTEPMLYEPGNYHIEINTFPKDIRNVDLDFDGETVITVPQPGFAKFTGEAQSRSVTLYQRLGDKFLSFYTLDLNDPKSQHLQIQPGEYQAHYQKGPGQGYAAEQVQQFRIRAAEVTDVVLK